MMEVWDRMLAKLIGCPVEQRVRVMVRAILFLSGIRGLHGVKWATRAPTPSVLLAPLTLHRTHPSSPSPPLHRLLQPAGPEAGTVLLTTCWRILLWDKRHETVCAVIAKQLLRAHVAHTASQGLAPGWEAHPEGRHRPLSGKHFLAASATRVGAEGMARAAGKLEVPLMHIIGGDPSAAPPPMPDVLLLAMLDAIRGDLVLAVRNCEAVRAGSYASMSVARTVWTWAVFSGRCSGTAMLSEEVFAKLAAAQSGRTRRQLGFCGIVDAASLEAKRRELTRVAVRGPRGWHKPSSPRAC